MSKYQWKQFVPTLIYKPRFMEVMINIYIYIGEYFSISKALSIYLKLKHIISLYQPFKPYYFNNWAIGEIDCTRIYVRDLFGKIPFFNNRISMVFFINQMLWYIYNIMPNSYNPFIKKKNLIHFFWYIKNI
jgi:hypothetical protein